MLQKINQYAEVPRPELRLLDPGCGGWCGGFGGGQEHFRLLHGSQMALLEKLYIMWVKQ